MYKCPRDKHVTPSCAATISPRNALTKLPGWEIRLGQRTRGTCYPTLFLRCLFGNKLQRLLVLDCRRQSRKETEKMLVFDSCQNGNCLTCKLCFAEWDTVFVCGVGTGDTLCCVCFHGHGCRLQWNRQAVPIPRHERHHYTMFATHKSTITDASKETACNIQDNAARSYDVYTLRLTRP